MIERGEKTRQVTEKIGCERWRPPNYLSSLPPLSSRVRSITVQLVQFKQSARLELPQTSSRGRG